MEAFSRRALPEKKEKSHGKRTGGGGPKTPNAHPDLPSSFHYRQLALGQRAGLSRNATQKGGRGETCVGQETEGREKGTKKILAALFKYHLMPKKKEEGVTPLVCDRIRTTKVQ